MAVTKLSNLIDPEVLADLVDKKLTDYIKFAPLARVDYSLQGVPGSTITVPSFNYIGDGTVVAENGEIVPVALTASTDTAEIYKIAKGVTLTDEAVLSGFGDPIGQAVEQLALAIAAGVDGKTLTTLEGIGSTMTFTKTTDIAADVMNALELFGEDIEGTKVLLVSPADYTKLRKSSSWLPASEISAAIVVAGAVGEIGGCQVVVTNKLKNKNEAFIVKPGALALYLKRDTVVESDRDIFHKSTSFTADKHFVTYLYDASKAIKIYAAG